MTYLDFLEQKVLLERLVIGLEEPVLIKGLGELSAKIDSGNGGYNVIHGTDFHQQGNELMFTTHDSFGHEKKMQATVIDTIEVNMGGGNIESRPVIELDIKFAGEDYKKIPFSVSDRSSNTNPILISKGFVENELEALIDVGAMNISHDKIDVVYGESNILGEGFFNPGDSPILQGMKKAGEKYNSAMGKIANFGKWLGGDAKMGDWLPEPSVTKKDKGMAEQIAKASENENKDATEIQTKMNNLTVAKKLKKDPKLDTTNNNVNELVDGDAKYGDLPVCLVTSHMMCKGAAADKSEIKGLEKDRESIKGWVVANKEKVQEEKNKRKGGNQQKQEGQNPQEQEEAPSDATPTGATPGATPTVQGSKTPDAQPTQGSGTPQEQKKDDEFEEVTTFFEQLCQFTLWFVSLEKIKDKAAYEKDFKEYIQSGKFDDILYKMFKSGVINPQTIEPYVKKLAERFQSDGKQGFFVLRWTPQSQTELKDEMKDVKRETYFYEDLQYVSYQKTKSSTPQIDKMEQEIDNQINPEDAQPAEVKEGQDGEGEGEKSETPDEEEPNPVDTPPTDGKEGEDGEVKDKSVDAPPADDEDEDEDSWNDQERYDYDNNVEFEEEPIDPWVKEKLNYLKKKGLI